MLKHIFLFAVVTSLFLIPCADAQQYEIRVGDNLHISVWGEDDLDKEVTVDDHGFIIFPLIEKVKAADLTIEELDYRITTLLKKDYLVNPKVSIAILNQQFFIMGEVKTPGSHPLKGKITVRQAVTLAGGFTEFASPRVKILRQREGREDMIAVNVNHLRDRKGQVKSKYYVKHNDVIIVKRSMF